MLMLLKRGGLAAGLAMLATTGAVAQSYPTRPVAITVPFAAGGPTDVVARTIADAMTRAMPGASVIVENVAGAGGTIGVTKIARASPDGYSLLIHHIGMSTAPALYRKLQFDPLKDFEYIGLINDVPMTMLVKNGFPPNNLKELVPYLKANAGKVSFANAGIGSASHLCGLMFMSAIEVDLTTVPYKGTAPAMTDLIGGQVQAMIETAPSAQPQFKAGKIRALATTTAQPVSTLPGVPTAAQAGLPGFEMTSMFGVAAPAGTPDAIIQRLSAELKKILAEPETRDALLAQGAVATWTTPDEATKAVNAEYAKWAKVIKDGNIKPE